MKIKLLLSLFIFYFIPIYAKSADPEIDSLNILLGQMGGKGSLKLIERVGSDAEKSGNTKLMIWSQNVMASIAFDNGNFEEVLKIGHQAKEQNIKFNNSSFTAHLFTMMGQSYSNLGFNEQGQYYLQLAILYARKIVNADNRHYRLGMIYNGQARNFEVSKEKSDSVLYYFKKGYAEFQFIKDNRSFRMGFRMSQNNLAAWYLGVKQYDSAKKYLDLMEISTQKDTPDLMEMYRLANLASFYYETGYYNKSLVNFNSTLILSNKFNAPYLKKYVYENLSKVNGALNNNVKEKLYQKMYLVILDSLAKEEKKAIRRPLADLLKDSRAYGEDKIGHYTVVLLIVISLLLIATYFGFLYFKKFKKERITSIELTRLIEEKMLQLEPSIRVFDEAHDEEMRGIIQMAIANDPAFFVQFNKFDQKFVQKIMAIAPTIIASELEFCALLKLNFETKEIARYTGLSVRAVEGKKYRVRKKLRIPSEEDLNIWMTKL